MEPQGKLVSWPCWERVKVPHPISVVFRCTWDTYEATSTKWTLRSCSCFFVAYATLGILWSLVRYESKAADIHIYCVQSIMSRTKSDIGSPKCAPIWDFFTFLRLSITKLFAGQKIFGIFSKTKFFFQWLKKVTKIHFWIFLDFLDFPGFASLRVFCIKYLLKNPQWGNLGISLYDW